MGQDYKSSDKKLWWIKPATAGSLCAIWINSQREEVPLPLRYHYPRLSSYPLQLQHWALQWVKHGRTGELPMQGDAAPLNIIKFSNDISQRTVRALKNNPSKLEPETWSQEPASAKSCCKLPSNSVWLVTFGRRINSHLRRDTTMKNAEQLPI